jgi:hypothetical protein
MSTGDWHAVVTLTIAPAVLLGAPFKVKRRREHFPCVEFTVDVDFVAFHRGQWVVSLNAFVVNK